MNINNSRFKIEALIQMAKITENSEKRENYIMQAEEELERLEFCQEHEENSLVSFFEEKCIAKKHENMFYQSPEFMYKQYIKFCKKNKLEARTREELFEFFEKMGVEKINQYGEEKFKLIIIS